MTLKSQCEGCLGAGPLRLELIVALQRWEEGKAVGERVVAWVAVKILWFVRSRVGPESRGRNDDREGMRDSIRNWPLAGNMGVPP